MLDDIDSGKRWCSIQNADSWPTYEQVVADLGASVLYCTVSVRIELSRRRM
jgi:hypothetical protein